MINERKQGAIYESFSDVNERRRTAVKKVAPRSALIAVMLKCSLYRCCDVLLVNVVPVCYCTAEASLFYEDATGKIEYNKCFRNSGRIESCVLVVCIQWRIQTICQCGRTVCSLPFLSLSLYPLSFPSPSPSPTLPLLTFPISSSLLYPFNAFILFSFVHSLLFSLRPFLTTMRSHLLTRLGDMGERCKAPVGSGSPKINDFCTF